jgi:CheY-like chemotaxis protein
VLSRRGHPIVILMADDDSDDCELTRCALRESRVVNDFYVVEDGEELMDFLKRRGPYSDPAVAPRPNVILLDLNMPRKTGREALEEIKGDPALRQIPVVVLTTSRAEEEIYRSYDIGANSFISKPLTFQGLVEVMKGLGRYWFEVVELPADAD